MLTIEDIAMYKAFKTIVKKGRFEISGEAIIVSGKLFTWFENLEKEIESQAYPDLEPSPDIPPITIVPKKQKLRG
jgi:hypothetical protein